MAKSKILLPQQPKYVPLNMPWLAQRPPPQISKSNFRILSRNIEGPEVLFQLGLKDDPTNVFTVHECSLQDLFKFVSPEALNEFENRLYEEEFQKELIQEKSKKRRGRPSGVPISEHTIHEKAPRKPGRPPGIPVSAVPTTPKVKGPRGRPRKTALAPPPVKSSEESSDSSEASSYDDLEDIEPKPTPVVAVPLSASDRKRKLHELQSPVHPPVDLSSTVILPINVPASARPSNPTSFATSPDEPTEWERRMMAKTGLKGPSRGSRRGGC